MTETVSSAVVVHAPDLTIIQCHGATQQLFNHSEQELKGKTLTQLGLSFLGGDGRKLPPKELPLSSIASENVHIKKSTIGIFNETLGTLIWTDMDGYPEYDGNGDIARIITTYVISSAITPPPATSDKSFKLKDIWEKTFDAMEDVITILSPDLRVLKANSATFSTFGIQEGELSGMYCYVMLQGKDEPCDGCPVWNPSSLTRGNAELIYNKRLDKTFEVRSSPVFDDDGTLKFLVHTARDVTRKLRDEEQTRRLSTVVEQTSESVIMTDRDGVIEYVNPSYIKTTGYSMEETAGKHISELHVQHGSVVSFEEIITNLKQGKTWQGHLTSRKKNGSIIEEHASVSPIYNGDGSIINFVAVKRDITREEQLQVQLRQAMKMEAIGTLAGGIAHDFNNILSAMIGYGQIAKGRLQKDDPLLSDIEQILLAGDRAANLVKQILAFARRDTQESFIPLYLQHIIKEVGTLIRSSFPATIEIKQEVESSCPPIMADPGQIHQVLMNLCTNAKQAIGENYGRLSMHLKHLSVPEPKIFSETLLLTSGEYAYLSIEDNGAGMSESIKERIFDPFFSTKPVGEGTGLGLSVVHGIVDKHGGIIVVDSQIDIGTSFHLYFPIIDHEPVAVEEKPEPEKRGNERVMLVDDEAVLTRIMQRTLTKLGYKVTAFTDAIKAVHYYRLNPNSFDVVITDMTMPNMTGAEFAREVLALRPELPVIMTTGYSESINEKKAKSIGITKFMLKPIKKKSLAKELREVLDNVQHTGN